MLTALHLCQLNRANVHFPLQGVNMTLLPSSSPRYVMWQHVTRGQAEYKERNTTKYGSSSNLQLNVETAVHG